MTIRQLSIFLENKAGTLQKVLSALKSSGIQLIASTLADTADFGIYRVICSEPGRAFDVLRAAGIAVTYSDVFAIELDNRPGMAAETMNLFAREDIDISYLYSFLLGGKGVLVFRTGNADRARELIILEHLRFITEEALTAMAES